ncbi:MAG: DNA polymerase III subunit gamma/tau [Deltaproteobacteria bacterium]|nr:DNA polymerase III subunit gamma/tau [Deltaproteobacteria bacterium]
MSYLVLARKWRPQKFDEVVGQAHVTRTLMNAIVMGRVAHAFLFAGARGVGKTSMARILAKSLNCVNGPTVTPCGQCESCRAVAAGTAVDVIEIDGASNNSVDDVRELRETVPYRPVLGRFKIYVIDEVHMLSLSAFNALLKTLEEPPPHVKFVFATTEPHKIPVTILSRCQRYDFRRIPTAAVVERIRKIVGSEGIAAEDAALALIGREAEGSMRDALSVLDQVLAAGVQKITAEAVADLLGVVARSVFYDLSAALLASDAKRCIEIVREVDRQGYDLPIFARGLLEHLRNLVVASVCEDDRGLLDLPEDEIDDLAAQARSAGRDTLHRLFKHFSEAFEAIARSQHSRILLETTLARLADLGGLVPAADLVSRLEAIAGGAQPALRSQPPAAPSRPAPKAPENPALPAKRMSGDDWGRILDELRRERPALASIFERCVPQAGDSPDVLLLCFDKGDGFSASAAEDRERQQDLEAFLTKRQGKPVRVAVRQGDMGGAPVAVRKRLEEEENERRREEEARQHPVVRQAVAELGGAVSKVRLKKDKERQT